MIASICFSILALVISIVAYKIVSIIVRDKIQLLEDQIKALNDENTQLKGVFDNNFRVIKKNQEIDLRKIKSELQELQESDKIQLQRSMQEAITDLVEDTDNRLKKLEK